MKIRRMTTNALQTVGETTAAAVATKTTYAGTLASIGGYIADSNAVALAGLFLAFLGFVANLVFRIREDIRQSEAHRLNMKRLQEQINEGAE